VLVPAVHAAKMIALVFAEDPAPDVAAGMSVPATLLRAYPVYVGMCEPLSAVVPVSASVNARIDSAMNHGSTTAPNAVFWFSASIRLTSYASE
jgi:hypothetical protein